MVAGKCAYDSSRGRGLPGNIRAQEDVCGQAGYPAPCAPLWHLASFDSGAVTLRVPAFGEVKVDSCTEPDVWSLPL